MATKTVMLDPVQVELFKLAFEKRQQAMQAAQLDMQTRIKVVADALGVPEGTQFNVGSDDASGALTMTWDVPDAVAEGPQLSLVPPDAGEGAEG